MPSSLVRICLLLLASLAAGSANPASANWRQTLMHGILPALAKRAAVSLIEKELYDLEEPAGATHSAPYDQTQRFQSRRNDGPQNFSPRPEWQFSPQNPTSASSSVPAHRSTRPSRSSAVSYLPTTGFEQKSNTPSHVNAVAGAFAHGNAGNLSFDQLVGADVFTVCPLHGSVFKRESSVKYIILHSTETGSPADARRVIQSWNNRGLRHPGAQFVVDRDGTICSTTNPDMATVHINIHKTLPGYTNDNSVGIEIVRSGKQRYTQPQVSSVMHLVAYLQDHYHVDDDRVTTHHHVQPSDRSDPVGFDLVAFQSAKSAFRDQALASTNRPSKPLSRSSFAPAPKSPLTISQRTSPLRSAHHLAQMPQPAPDFRRISPAR